MYIKYYRIVSESATDEQDEQLPEPNGSLSKSMPTKAIQLANAEILNKLKMISLGSAQKLAGYHRSP